MAITGRGLVAAETAVTITIGRHTHVARPISVPTMMRVQTMASSGRPIDMINALLLVLAASFPDRPRWRRWRDPVRQILSLDRDTQQKVFRALTAIPGLGEVETDPTDPLAATRAWQRAAVRGDAGRKGGLMPSLELAARTCRSAFGETWYYNPARWPTVDGFVPHTVCWVDYLGLDALDARRELSAVRAEAVVRASRAADVQRQIRALERRAFPSTVMVS
jgi:hypothetical protein